MLAIHVWYHFFVVSARDLLHYLVQVGTFGEIEMYLHKFTLLSLFVSKTP